MHNENSFYVSFFNKFKNDSNNKTYSNNKFNRTFSIDDDLNRNYKIIENFNNSIETGINTYNNSININSIVTNNNIMSLLPMDNNILANHTVEMNESKYSKINSIIVTAVYGIAVKYENTNNNIEIFWN